MAKKVLIAILLVSLLVPAVIAKPVLISKSKKSTPKWITLPPQESEFLYFIGSKSKAPTYEDGVKTALANAMSEVMMNIGFTFAMQTEITTRIEADKDLSSYVDNIQQTGSAELKDQRIKEIYFEKYKDTKMVVENNIQKKVEQVYYDVYLLLKYSKSEIAKERKKKEQKDAENAKIARGFLTAAETMLGSSQVMDAYNKYASVIKILSAQAGIPLFNEALAAIKNISQNIVLSEAPAGSRKEIPVRVAYETDQAKAPVSRAVLKTAITMGSGEIDNTVSTGLDGIGLCRIQKMTFDGGLAKILITLDSEPFVLPLKDTAVQEKERKAVEDTITSKTLTITLKSSQFGASKVCVIIWDKAGGRNKELESMITEALTKAGISVVVPQSLKTDLSFNSFDSPDFYSQLSQEGISVSVVGQSEATDNGNIYGMQSVLGVIDSRVIDVKKQQVLTTISKNVPKVGNSFLQAKTNCFKTIADLITPTIVSTVSAE